MNRSYPLHWPAGRPRTAVRKTAMFRDAGRPVTLTKAEKRLVEQFELMTRAGRPHRATNRVLSSNIRYTASGSRDQNVSRKDPGDPGVAVAFDLDGKPIVLACDRWDTVADNIAAIAAHIEALRGQERWGVADLVQAFAGHIALPAPEQWWQALGLTERASPVDIEAAYRRLARAAHPDLGGSDAAMARLNAAADAARKAQG